MRRIRSEQGVVAIVVALIVVAVLVPLAGIAVDLGVQRVARRDMQSLADVVALDLARHLDGKTTVAQWSTASPSLQDLADRSVSRNAGTTGDAPTVTPTLGKLEPDPENPARFRFEPLPEDSGEVPDAVSVQADTAVGFGFMPGTGGASRTAVAKANSTACFELGSYAAAIRSDDSSLLQPLNSLLGLNLDLLSYKGLANEKINLADLATDSHIGGVDQLFSSDLSFASLVQATIDLVQKQDPSNDVVLEALGAFQKLSADTPTVNLADQIGIAPTDEAALETDMSVLDLLSGAVLLADGEHAVDITNLQAHVAGVGNIVDSTLTIVQGKQRACGAPNSDEAHATATQLNGVVDFGDMNSPSVNIPGLATLQTSPATGKLTIRLGNAEGQLVSPPDVHCGDGTTADPDTYSVRVYGTQLAEVALHSQLNVTGKVSILGLGKVSVHVVVDLGVGTQQAAGSQTLQLSIPPNDTDPVSTGSGTALTALDIHAAIDPSSKLTVEVLGLPVSLSLDNPLLAPLLNGIIDGLVGPTAPLMTNTLQPLIKNINDELTGPLAKLLGLTVAGADVYAVPRPVCDAPQLVG